MRKPNLLRIGIFLAGFTLLIILVYYLPPVNQRLSWRLDFAMTYLRAALHPIGDIPTALPQPEISVTLHPTNTPSTIKSVATPTISPTAMPTQTPIPLSTNLESPGWEKQDINNCGPATLAMYLRYYGWDGDQYPIADLLKPHREDRNVNVEELLYYVRTQAGWLDSEYRVGGDIQLLKDFLAAGIPVMIEEGFYLDEGYWPNDDRWAGHYLLINGYDDVNQTFLAQDSFRGADQAVPYQKVDRNWQAFNRVYILLYHPEQADIVKTILGTNWDPDTNRQHALDIAQAETASDPRNAYPWFNLGTNLVYFERYAEAARAYDTARNLGLPQRMLRYQFGPFFAYFFSGRNADLLALSDYALERTPNAEEALLWHGWALYRDGDNAKALADFQKALEENPNYQDAKYALDFVRQNP